MDSWNDIPMAMSFQMTNFDLFNSLRSTGSIPTDIDYQKKVCNWLKFNVLNKKDLNCREEEWLMKYTHYFYGYITKLWRENNGSIDLNNPDFKAFSYSMIIAYEDPDHSCLKCSPPLPMKTKKIKLIPNQVSKYRFHQLHYLCNRFLYK